MRKSKVIISQRILQKKIRKVSIDFAKFSGRAQWNNFVTLSSFAKAPRPNILDSIFL